jgi:hypothetical protein
VDGFLGQTHQPRADRGGVKRMHPLLRCLVCQRSLLDHTPEQADECNDFALIVWNEDPGALWPDIGDW